MIEYIDKYNNFLKSVKVGDTIYVPNYITNSNPIIKTSVVEINKIKLVKKNPIDRYLLRFINSQMIDNNKITGKLINGLSYVREKVLNFCIKKNIACEEIILLATSNGKMYNAKECSLESCDVLV